MPFSDDGIARPFTDIEKQTIGSYMADLIRQGEKDHGQIVFAAGAHFQLDYDDRLRLWSILRQTIRSVEAGTFVGNNPTQPPAPNQVPNIPSDPQYWGRYVYDLFITWTDPQTGLVARLRDVAVFDEPASANDVRNYVSANAPDFACHGSGPGAGSCDPNVWTLDIIILSVSRGS